MSDGLVASLNQPGGNVTGVSFFNGALGSKRLEMLRQLVPKVTIIGMLVYPNTPETEAERRDVQAAAQTVGQQLIMHDVKSGPDIDTAFAAFIQAGVGAAARPLGAFLGFKSGTESSALAARNALPASYAGREAADAGGLMSYAPSIKDTTSESASTPAEFSKAKSPPTCR